MTQSCEVIAPTTHVEKATLQLSDRLFVKYRKRMTQRWVTNEEGAKELHLHYGLKEICFDEAHLFPWGQHFAKQTAFVAGDATAWGAGHSWEEIRPLLEALISEGILLRGDTQEDGRGSGLVPSLLPPSTCPFARSWSAAEAEGITSDLAGRPVEIGYLEAILSVYRIPHPALDGDGRQVAEANVFPPALRLDTPTEWRVCQYSGSRYGDERPMNVTALKAMIKHWKPMMVALLDVRAEMLGRITRSTERDASDPASKAKWTVGDMHIFSAALLSLPAYALMKKGGTSPQPPLHPVISSLFRISEGIRMTTHKMLFLSEERTRDPGELTSAEELYGFSERQGLFLSDHGVCAGPRPLIDEFLAIAFDGLPVEGAEAVELAPEVKELLGELPAAVDYGLLGLMNWGITRSVWCQMSLVYKELRELFGTATGATAERFFARLEDDWFNLDFNRIADDYDRDVHMDVYRDSYEQGRLALRQPFGAETLAERIAPATETDEHRALAERMRERLAAHFADSTFPGREVSQVAARMAELFTHFVREEQTVLASACELQEQINALLDRQRPTRPLTIRDLRVNYGMYGGFVGQFPYLFDMLHDEVGFRVEATKSSLEIELAPRAAA
jgi:hypothetical protein